MVHREETDTVRRKDRALTDRQQIETIIERSTVCRIALFDSEFPYMIPMSFGYAGGRVYIHSAPEGKKIQLIKKDNRVCFEMEAEAELVEGETPCRWSMRYSSVVGFGKAHLVENAEERRKGLEIIFRHYSRDPFDIPEESAGRVVVIRIDVESMTGKASAPLS